MNEKNIALTLIVLCALAAVIALVKPSAHKVSSEKKEMSVDSELLKKAIGSKKIKVLPLEGTIYDSMAASSPFRADYNAAYLKKELVKAIEDDSIKAVMLRVNSPGGTVATSQELYKLVLKLRENGKPVVVSMSDVCASGCYYISSAADRIVANKGTLTGSIGVISSGVNYKLLFEKLGLKDQTIKAGKYKDLGNGARDVTAEEKAILQRLIDNSYKQFLEDIHFARGIEMDKLKKIAQGLIYTGEQALEVNLVDELGTYEDAKLAMLALLKKAGHEKADSYTFDEAWNKTKLKSIEKLLDINPFSKLDFADLFAKYDFTQIPEQILWMHR